MATGTPKCVKLLLLLSILGTVCGELAFFHFLWTSSGRNYTLNFVDATLKYGNHWTSENSLLQDKDMPLSSRKTAICRQKTCNWFHAAAFCQYIFKWVTFEICKTKLWLIAISIFNYSQVFCSILKYLNFQFPPIFFHP